MEKLVDKYFSEVYPSYELVREMLVRQARDLLVCQYLGHVANFEKEFLVPASAEARRLIDQVRHFTILYVLIMPVYHTKWKLWAQLVWPSIQLFFVRYKTFPSRMFPPLYCVLFQLFGIKCPIQLVVTELKMVVQVYNLL